VGVMDLDAFPRPVSSPTKGEAVRQHAGPPVRAEHRGANSSIGTSEQGHRVCASETPECYSDKRRPDFQWELNGAPIG
jgi:hypothetical protein